MNSKRGNVQFTDATNFHFQNGVSAKAFVKYAKDGDSVVLSVEEAEAVQAKWAAAWPEVAAYCRAVRESMDAPPDAAATTKGDE